MMRAWGRGAGDGADAAAGAECRRPLLPPLHFRHHRPAQRGGDSAPPGALQLHQHRDQLGAFGARHLSAVFVALYSCRWSVRLPDAPVLLGGKIILARSLEVEESLRVIEEEGCTVILGVPTIFQMWMKSPRFAAADFSRVRWFVSGGAPCPEATMQVWREQKGVVFRQGYGLTEVGPNCFSMTDAESLPKSGSVGKPIFHSEMRIVDESGRERPVGEVGELLIRGPHVCSGYWKNPQASAESIRDG